VQLQYTDRFARAYSDLDASNGKRVDKALRLLGENLQHNSLYVKKVEGTKDIWEARASDSIRLTFQMQADVIVLRNVGPHDEILRNP
jgi:mRNA interferase RelE/StbE